MFLLFCAIGVIFIVLAIPLLRRKVPPNHFYGLRVGETMENEDVWYEANARSAKDLVRVGLGTIVISGVLFFLPWQDPDHYILTCCALLIVGVLAYAFRGLAIARQVKEEQGSVSEPM